MSKSDETNEFHRGSVTENACQQLLRYGGGVFNADLGVLLEHLVDLNDDIWNSMHTSVVQPRIDGMRETLDKIEATHGEPLTVNDDLQALHDLLYAAQRASGETKDKAIDNARLVLYRVREARAVARNELATEVRRIAHKPGSVAVSGTLLRAASALEDKVQDRTDWHPMAAAPASGLILLMVGTEEERRIFPAEASHENGELAWMITMGWEGWKRLHGAWTPLGWRHLQEITP